MEIFEFITEKARIAEITRDELAKKCNVSRSTMHRYIHGEYNIPKVKEEYLAKALNLTDAEKEEMHTIITQMVPRKPMQKAYQAMDDLVFGSKTEAEQSFPSEGEVLFFGQDRYMLSIDQVFDTMLRNSNKENFHCAVKINHGTGEQYFAKLVEFLEKVFLCSPGSTAEHLISFPTKDYTKSIETLTAALPLLKYKNYTLYYTESERAEDLKGTMNRSFYVSTSYTDEHQRVSENYLCSILEYSQAEVYCFSDPFLHEFITNDFYDLRRQFTNSIQEFRDLGVCEQFLISMEQQHDSFLLKPDICYNHIPAQVYKKQQARYDPEEQMIIAERIAGKPVAPEESQDVIDAMIKTMESRINNSYKRIQTEVCSKTGLLEFVKTGRIIDHMVWLPSFNKEEIRMCLEYIRDRNENKNDSYQLYLTEQDIMRNEYIIVGFKGDGVFIEFNRENYCTCPTKNLYIKNKTIADVVCDYVESHIPSNHTVTREETTAYIDHLIDTYL